MEEKRGRLLSEKELEAISKKNTKRGKLNDPLGLLGHIAAQQRGMLDRYRVLNAHFRMELEIARGRQDRIIKLTETLGNGKVAVHAIRASQVKQVSKPGSGSGAVVYQFNMPGTIVMEDFEAVVAMVGERAGLRMPDGEQVELDIRVAKPDEDNG